MLQEKPDATSAAWRGLHEGIRISRQIEVTLESGSSYYVTRDEAKALTSTNQGTWDGPRRIRRAPDTSERGNWIKCQSGWAGPMVMQLR